MARPRKRRGDPPRPSQEPVPAPDAERPPADDFAEFGAKHPEGFYITAIPGAKEAGLPYVGIVSELDDVQRDLELLRMGKAVGRHERDKERPRLGRPQSLTRLERGKIILQANRDGTSWKQMPSHVLSAYPDWFPQYRDAPPVGRERKRFEERLRKMARDAAKPAK